jgi:hypothetical protein
MKTNTNRGCIKFYTAKGVAGSLLSKSKPRVQFMILLIVESCTPHIKVTKNVIQEKVYKWR